MDLQIYRMHPEGVRLEKAERTLKGAAPQGALKWCGPYTFANKTGWWVYPPMDVDIIFDGQRFQHRILSPFQDLDGLFMRDLVREDDPQETKDLLSAYTHRLKLDYGRVEPNIVQMWTGCIFKTPPGWCLWVRSPVNVGMDQPYRIQEGILDTDWMPYDIWFNIAVTRKNEVCQIRRNQWPPLAQLIPVKRETYDEEWDVKDRMLNRNDPECNDMLLQWSDYTYKKYLKKGQKDSGTFFKERSKHLNGEQNE